MFCFNLIGVSHYHLVVLALINLDIEWTSTIKNDKD